MEAEQKRDTSPEFPLVAVDGCSTPKAADSGDPAQKHRHHFPTAISSMATSAPLLGKEAKGHSKAGFSALYGSAFAKVAHFLSPGP